MDKGAAVLLTVAAGGLIALQAPINSTLGKTIGTFPASSISFLIGTLALIAIALLVGGGYSRLGEVSNLSVVYLTGGVLGAIYVTTVLVTVRSLGAGGATAATIAGQLTMSVAIDRAGVLGLERQPLSAGRLLGVALLAAGTYLIVREA